MADESTLHVKVIHGDLRHASYPLAVGHYEGDVIVNAEAQIDAALGGALRRRFDMGVYPGPLGTSEIILQKARPPGAIVVGLGAVGDLTADTLRLAFARALRRYALAVAERTAARDAVAVPFSSLLVGTDGGALGTLADAIHAIVRGALDANRSLAQASFPRPVRIETIQFVELYDDVAIRAGHIVRDLPGPLERDLEANEHVAGAAQIDVRPGGRSFHPADPYAVGWWQRIAVRRKADDGAAPSPDAITPLQFTVLTDRARLEQETSIGQRALIQQLVSSATERTDRDLELSAALFRLVVPARVQDRIARGSDLLFMVDRVGAAYPYELMAMRTAGGRYQTLIETRGVLRQFETGQFRVQPEMARADRMFIVGNPRTVLFDDLPGAQREADEVARVAQAVLSVERAPREDGERTIVKLVTGEFRILHFAAHGQFDPDPMKSGVVVSDRLRFTPAEVATLPVVPELVFLNCCYLGRMDAPRQSGPDPRLAASLAEGFIQAGVRAVIAAGWAVDDEAGRTFACTFYEKFLRGMPFGDAVKTARAAVVARHPTTNTWGAYQCYGNPDYRFIRSVHAKADATARPFVARTEALQALRTLASCARSMHAGEETSLLARLEGLREQCRQWSTEGEILACCGEIFGELGHFDDAIASYRQALESVPATAALLIVEQLANLLTRSAADLRANGATPDAVLAHFDEAEGWLTWLDGKLQPSKERAALWGALYKRRAIYDPANRMAHLAKAAAAYRRASELAKKAPYATLNAIALQFLLSSDGELPALRHLMDERLAATTASVDGDQDFWAIVARPDTLLHRHLVWSTLADPATCALVIDGYLDARATGPSLREWASVRDHVEFLATMLEAGLPHPDPGTAAALQRIRTSLE